MKITNLLQAAPVDTVSRGIQAELAAAAEKIATTPTSELLSDLVDKALSFGLKVVAAIAIYFVGAWLIKKIKNLLKRIFEKRDFEPAIESFIQSIVGIALWIVLIIAVIVTLGV